MTNEEKLARLNLFLSGVVDQLEEIKKDFCKEPREMYLYHNTPNNQWREVVATELSDIPDEVECLKTAGAKVIKVREVMDEQTAN